MIIDQWQGGRSMSSSDNNPDKPIPLLDVPAGNLPLRDQLLESITRVCDSGRFLFGPDVAELEQAMAGWCGVDHAISCASGSDSLLLSLMMHKIGPGDEVIVPSFTFFATASAVWRLGARPVFVDIDPASFNIDPAAIEAAVTSNTKAIIPVHLFGQCAQMPRIMEIANKHQLLVVEDAAQSLGASLQEKPAGSWGQIGCISFYPTKNLGGMGDGGMLVTDDEEIADQLRLYAAHGMRPRYEHHVVGINSRLDSIQAAVLNIKIKHLEEANRCRQENAEIYQQQLAAAEQAGDIQLPWAEDGMLHVWNQFTIRVPAGRRDALKQHLADCQIGSEIYYPIPLHLQTCFSDLGVGLGDLPETERAAADVLSLPIFAELSQQQIERVATSIKDFLASSQRSAA